MEIEKPKLYLIDDVVNLVKSNIKYLDILSDEYVNRDEFKLYMIQIIGPEIILNSMFMDMDAELFMMAIDVNPLVYDIFFLNNNSYDDNVAKLATNTNVLNKIVGYGNSDLYYSLNIYALAGKANKSQIKILSKIFKNKPESYIIFNDKKDEPSLFKMAVESPIILLKYLPAHLVTVEIEKQKLEQDIVNILDLTNKMKNNVTLDMAIKYKAQYGGNIPIKEYKKINELVRKYNTDDLNIIAEIINGEKESKLLSRKVKAAVKSNLEKKTNHRL